MSAGVRFPTLRCLWTVPALIVKLSAPNENGGGCLGDVKTWEEHKVSFLTLLSLDDDSIELVTRAVRHWCEDHKVPLESPQGREAMSEAIRLAVGGEKSPEIIADALGRHMRIAHYKRPTVI